MYPTISPEKYEWGLLGQSEADRLAALGLSAADFDVFRQEFILHPWDFVLNSGNGPRQVRGGALSNALLVSHLEGGPIVSTRCARVGRQYVTHWLWFDLDAAADLTARYDQLRAVFPACPLVFQSSESRGLHCLYRLAEPTPILSLCNADGAGVIPRVLAGAGLELRPGRVEFYPQPAMREWLGNAIRAPFGKGSLLLCPDELIPLCSNGVAALRQVARRLADSKLDTLSLDELTTLAGRRVRKRGRPPKRTTSTASRGPSRIADEWARLDAEGLTGPGQLNEALFLLSLRSASRRLPFEDAESLSLSWLDAHHNGQSRTYNRSPHAAHDEARQILRKVYDTYQPAREWAPAPGLTATEIAFLDAVTPAGHHISDEDGVPYPRLKYLRFLFDVVNGMKQWVLSRAIETARRVLLLRPNHTLGSPDFDRAFDVAVRPWWPSVPASAFAVDCPYSFRLAINGVSEHCMNAFWRRAHTDGLFPVARLGSEWGQRCAAYHVRLDFAGVLFPSLAEALTGSLTADVFAERYGPQATRTIRSTIATPLAPAGVPSAVTEYVWRRLRGESAPTNVLSYPACVKDQEAA